MQTMHCSTECCRGLGAMRQVCARKTRDPETLLIACFVGSCWQRPAMVFTCRMPPQVWHNHHIRSCANPGFFSLCRWPHTEAANRHLAPHLASGMGWPCGACMTPNLHAMCGRACVQHAGTRGSWSMGLTLGTIICRASQQPAQLRQHHSRGMCPHCWLLLPLSPQCLVSHRLALDRAHHWHESSFDLPDVYFFEVFIKPQTLSAPSTGRAAEWKLVR